ncbi:MULTISPECIES: hypothetical protein [unclassified Streptococcus]|uniref:hypothetical protein n=1 Tax=unclassified Streptococcus TaxID=2608887 RepID=UPI00211AEEB3|nr:MULTISPECIES: hypothetical protein [unclassified Streptococcus]MCQ9211633.1 hypothetical protein [Streptococcus sp. B01]MCQ9213151.1 hypothetical protein [Streptococcus sp. O1]MCQ9214940.1 hypothetical protein [Streptococcus sp. O1]MCQ9215072.1 hypothetical protein [Streptococcus sp. O1]
MKFVDRLKNFLGLDTLEEEQSDIVLTDVKKLKRIAQEKHEEAKLYQELYNEVMYENHRLRKTIQTLEDMRKLGIGGF